MPETSRIYISNEADRLTVAAILVKNGYTVSQGRTRNPKGKNYIHHVEYSKEAQLVEE